jgi:hypothetical protein
VRVCARVCVCVCVCACVCVCVRVWGPRVCVCVIGELMRVFGRKEDALGATSKSNEKQRIRVR